MRLFWYPFLIWVTYIIGTMKHTTSFEPYPVWMKIFLIVVLWGITVFAEIINYNLKSDNKKSDNDNTDRIAESACEIIEDMYQMVKKSAINYPICIDICREGIKLNTGMTARDIDYAKSVIKYYTEYPYTVELSSDPVPDLLIWADYTHFYNYRGAIWKMLRKRHPDWKIVGEGARSYLDLVSTWM